MRTIRNHRRLTRLLGFTFGLVLVVVTSCDKHTRIAQTSWADLDSVAGKRWEVKTTDAKYLVERFTVTDSTVVLDNVLESSSYDGERYSATRTWNKMRPHRPIVVSFGDIESIERVERSKTRTALLIVGVDAGVWIIVGLTAAWVLEGELEGAVSSAK